MAIYSIVYHRPGEGRAIHELGAASDAQARIRFMNLSWVAFTSISIVSIALKAEQPDMHRNYVADAKRDEDEAITENLTRKHERDKAAPKPKASPSYDWRAECDRLTVKIGTLADEAQELTRKGQHDEADKLRAKARELAAMREQITKRSKKK